MIRYKNLKTGAIISTACELRGGDWVRADEAPPVKPPQEPAEELRAPKKENTSRPEANAPIEDLDGYTVAELRDIADERGIEYKSGLRKAELIELIEKES